ncbi:YigZ family protein [Halioglobus japonicus]|uniref:YigZ family protein n=1 Tax=Halioglobus japonicus TaxID=930805 RepID=A0AAP8MH85_9GAMM|nr:YigZ family protein [Halioglobus japonicus]AQA19178.1 YigZ family protein [Halioglobus japonicus]PLW87786.1 YigZ family protein [Halioglobus japonicus]GHD06575.1 YigZ family protein [Halioglobus japonicus]
MAYLIPAAVIEHEYAVKKSRFIARVHPVSNRDEVNAAVRCARSDYPDARHHCWAYLLGSPADARNAGMNDDGEPSGTAGKPMLNVLQHGEVGDVLVIVIRYFGGIKLGAGGLVRAYSAATQQAMDKLPTRALRDMCRLVLSANFADEQALRHRLGQLDAEIEHVDYREQVWLHISLPVESESALRAFCAAHSVAVNVIDTA